MAKYKKRADGRYCGKIPIGIDETGKPRYKYIYARTITEFEQKTAEVKASVYNGSYSDDKKLTVRVWADHWLKTFKTDKSFATISGYQNIIKNHISIILDIRLKDLTKSHVQQCINAATGHYDIQRRIKLTLNQMLEAAIDDGLIYRNVCRGVSLPKKPKTDTRALTDKEKQVIPKCDFTEEERCFVYLLWFTGMRPEEARALTIQDIDLNRGTIQINKALSFTKNQPVLGPPKTDSGYRTIDILSPLRPILSTYLPLVEDLYLFTNKSGSFHTKTTYRRFWNKIYNKINTAMGGTENIKATDITPYVFRHEYATMLYYSQVDIKDAARLMGHTDTKMILEVYAELDSKKSKSTSKLEAFLSNSY